MQSLNCSNLCIALRPNRYFKVKLNRILHVKTRYVALETAKESRNASKNVNSICIIISYFNYERYIIAFAIVANHIAIYVGSCSIILNYIKN